MRSGWSVMMRRVKAGMERMGESRSVMDRQLWKGRNGESCCDELWRGKAGPVGIG